MKFYSAILLLLISGAAYSSRAGTFVVTSVADPGDGTCTAAEIGDGCTLREAINAANAGAGADMIDATGVSGTIGLTAALPDLSSDITILGPGPTVLRVSRSATARFRIFTILSNVTVNISGVTITGGWTADGLDSPDHRTQTGGAGGPGGGLSNSGICTLTGCTVSGNHTGNGGTGGYGSGGAGGAVYNSGTLTMINSTVSGNQTGNGGAGGPAPGGGPPGGTGGYGGGVSNIGTATLVNSTVSGNITGTGGSTFFGNDSIPGNGGGIDNGSTLILSNCTISGNKATADSYGRSYNGGGGIYQGAGSMTISNSTVTNNGAGNGGGIHQVGLVTLRSSIVAGNSAYLVGPDIYGATQSDGYNLIGNQGGATISPNPGAGPDAYGPANLEPLADNGGPTLTHLPRSDSPAIDKGKNFTASNTDQRGVGFARVVDQPDSNYPNAADATDVGAVELAPLFTPTPTATPTATATPTPSPTARPLVARNISTRARIETGDNVMIAGFTISGISLPKKVVIRGLGPSLEDMGVVGVVADPVLELRGSDGALIFGNDDWQDNSEQAAQIQASGLAPTRSQESAIEVTLVPGSYTAIVRGKNNTSGIGLVEVYDVDDPESQLANLSTRGVVHGGDSVMIAGFTLGGTNNTARIAIRALGPSLSNAGLTNVLEDPTVELRDENGTLMVSNDNWNDDAASAAKLTANGLALPDAKESGIFADALPPGQFTAIVAGKNGGSGIALVEVYNLN